MTHEDANSVGALVDTWCSQVRAEVHPKDRSQGGCGFFKLRVYVQTVWAQAESDDRSSPKGSNGIKRPWNTVK